MKILENHLMEQADGKRYHMSDDIVQDIEDTIFDPESPTLVGDIFRWSQKEHGRCISKVYVSADPEGAVNWHVGWVFQKREKYEDVNEYYLHETWVTLLDKDEVRREREYHKISGS